MSSVHMFFGGLILNWS